MTPLRVGLALLTVVLVFSAVLGLLVLSRRRDTPVSPLEREFACLHRAAGAARPARPGHGLRRPAGSGGDPALAVGGGGRRPLAAPVRASGLPGPGRPRRRRYGGATTASAGRAGVAGIAKESAVGSLAL